MTTVLVRIKRAVLAGRYAFSEKARLEMEADGLTESDVAESILNAVAIYKRIRSRRSRRSRRTEHLYVIQATNLDGTPRVSSLPNAAKTDSTSWSPPRGPPDASDDTNLPGLRLSFLWRGRRSPGHRELVRGLPG